MGKDWCKGFKYGSNIVFQGDVFYQILEPNLCNGKVKSNTVFSPIFSEMKLWNMYGKTELNKNFSLEKGLGWMYEEGKMVDKN